MSANKLTVDSVEKSVNSSVLVDTSVIVASSVIVAISVIVVFSVIVGVSVIVDFSVIISICVSVESIVNSISSSIFVEEKVNSSSNRSSGVEVIVGKSENSILFIDDSNVSSSSVINSVANSVVVL